MKNMFMILAAIVILLLGFNIAEARNRRNVNVNVQVKNVHAVHNVHFEQRVFAFSVEPVFAQRVFYTAAYTPIVLRPVYEVVQAEPCPEPEVVADPCPPCPPCPCVSQLFGVITVPHVKVQFSSCH